MDHIKTQLLRFQKFELKMEKGGAQKNNYIIKLNIN